MALFKSRQTSSSSPQSGISAGEWLQSRKKEALNEGLNKSSKKYAFLDDSSSDESFSASNFLRKSGTQDEDFPLETKKKNVADPERPKTSRGTPEKKTPASYSTRGGGNALARFSNLEKQILSRQNIPAVMTSSDMDLDISSDSEIRREVQNIKRRQQEISAPKNIPLDPTKKTQPGSGAEDSKSDSKRSEAKKKSVSFASKLVVSQLSESSASLDEFLPDRYSSDEVSLDDVLPASNLYGVMSLDDLQPAEHDTKPDVLSLHSVDELLPASVNDEPSKEEFDDKNESYSSVDSDSDLFNLHSIEDLVPETPSFAPPQDKVVVDQKEKQNIQYAAREKEEERIDDYSEDFHSDSDDTLKDTESITQDITEEIKSETTESVDTESIATQTKDSYSDSYTDSFESDDTHTRSSTPPSAVCRKPAPRHEMSVQTDPLDFLSAPYVERKFTDSEKTFYKPSQIINNEALAVLSMYSPGVLAVQEMLKQQLAFTRDFVTRSERLHEAAADTLIADYQYASIEEARQAINAQRLKMRLPPKYPSS